MPTVCTRSLTGSPPVPRARKPRNEKVLSADIRSYEHGCTPGCTRRRPTLGRTGSLEGHHRSVGCSSCTGHGNNVEHHEEVSCTGRIALLCTRVLGPYSKKATCHRWAIHELGQTCGTGEVSAGVWICATNVATCNAPEVSTLE